MYLSENGPHHEFAESVLSLHVHLFKSKFHPAGTVLHRFYFPVSIFYDKSI